MQKSQGTRIPSKGNIFIHGAAAYLCLSNSLGKYWQKEEGTWLSYAVWICFCDILVKNVSSSYSLWKKLSWKKELWETIDGNIISGCYSWILLVEGSYPWGLMKPDRMRCFPIPEGKERFRKGRGGVWARAPANQQAHPSTCQQTADRRQSSLAKMTGFGNNWPTNWIQVSRACIRIPWGNLQGLGIWRW